MQCATATFYRTAISLDIRGRFQTKCESDKLQTKSESESPSLTMIINVQLPLFTEISLDIWGRFQTKSESEKFQTTSESESESPSLTMICNVQ